MKQFNTTFLIALFLISTIIPAHAQLTTPRPSPQAKTIQTIGVTDVTIDYSRPSVNDREIWGQLVPYGLNNLGFGTSTAAPWRAGANENTIISFEHDVKVGDKNVKAGIYGLHLIVNEDNSATVILSKDANNWGSYFYDPANDAARVDIQTIAVPFTEMLTYSFIDVSSDSATALLSWGEKGFPFTISTNTTKLVLDQFRDGKNGQMGFNRQNWEQAAAYALNNDGDLNEALNWIDTAIHGQFFSQKNFNNLAIKAQIKNKMGDTEAYNKLVDEAGAMANPQQLNTLGYQMLNAKDYKRSKEFFEMAIEKDPTNANAYDSMGDFYKTTGDKAKAIKFFKKALSMNPPPNVKASSENHLKELGAL